jgi:long-chain acyl-CoA synthetase
LNIIFYTDVKMKDRSWFKFWPEGVPKHVEYPEIPLFKFLIDSAEKHPDKPALSYKGKNITYSELNKFSDSFANRLMGMGTEAGHRIMLFLPNIPEYVISYYGVLKAGAVVTAASPLFKEMELEYQLDDCGAETVITNRSLYPIVEHIHENTYLKNIIVVDEDEDDLYTEQSEELPPQKKLGLNPRKETAVLQYTGGTTGIPKGAMMTHYNLVANAIQNAKWFGWAKDDVVLAILPFCHTWSTCVCINSPIMIGATVVLLDRFHPEEVLKTIEKEKITICYGAAAMFNLLVNHPGVEGYDLSSLRIVKAGAMPIPEETKRKWDRLSPVELTLGYGLTEASPETLNSPPHRVKPGTVGIPITDTDARIVDLETGTKNLAPGETGELVLRGPQVTSGYWKKPDETKRVLRNGWLHTGDVARMDEEGYITIIDRRKDLIKYKGYSVFPAEIENTLYEHPAVKECLVIGKPNPEFGEVPKAFVVVKEGISTTADELIAFCENGLAPYKKIRDVEFVAELPKTIAGKPLRRVLRKRLSSS